MTPMLEFLPEKRATAREMLSHPWLDGIMTPTLPLPPAIPLDPPPELAANVSPSDRNDQGEGMMEEDRLEDIQHEPRGEKGEGEEPLAGKELIEEETIHDPDGIRGPSSDALIPPEDFGLIVAEASSSGAVTMMEV